MHTDAYGQVLQEFEGRIVGQVEVLYDQQGRTAVGEQDKGMGQGLKEGILPDG